MSALWYCQPALCPKAGGHHGCHLSGGLNCQECTPEQARPFSRVSCPWLTPPTWSACRVVSFGTLVMHFPASGLPQLRDLRLFAQSLTSNLDYAGPACDSLAHSLASICIATRQHATATVLCQLLDKLGRPLQRMPVNLPASKAQLQHNQTRGAASQAVAPGPSQEGWTWLVSGPGLMDWAKIQHCSISRIFASYAAAQFEGADGS